MTTLQPAASLYHDPTPTRPRRSSSRRSVASSLSRSTSHLDSPRTPCPRDGDAFSYNPSHLRIWYLPQELWDQLPTQLQSTLAAVQHSGAAVLTGFERLNEHTVVSDAGRPDLVAAVDEQLLVQLDELPSPKFRTISNASSLFQSDISFTSTSASPPSRSECASPVTSSMSPLQAALPASPLSLGPSSVFTPDKLRSRSRERSFSTPLEPHDAYYATELSHLRTEALPRLRHKCHKVDTDWYEAKRTGHFALDDINSFDKWWVEKKCTVATLNEECKRLATANGLANTGLGWSAP